MQKRFCKGASGQDQKTVITLEVNYCPEVFHHSAYDTASGKRTEVQVNHADAFKGSPGTSSRNIDNYPTVGLDRRAHV